MSLHGVKMEKTVDLVLLQHVLQPHCTHHHCNVTRSLLVSLAAMFSKSNHTILRTKRFIHIPEQLVNSMHVNNSIIVTFHFIFRFFLKPHLWRQFWNWGQASIETHQKIILGCDRNNLVNGVKSPLLQAPGRPGELHVGYLECFI